MTIGLLVTTINSDAQKFIETKMPNLAQFDQVVLSHQIYDSNSKPIPNEIISKYSNLTYNVIYSKGISKNRNNSLKFCNTDICYISDDDCKYTSDAYQVIKNSFKEMDSDALIFPATFDKENEKLINKKYYSGYKLKKYDSLFVVNMEISFKMKSYLKYQMSFNEEFGLGTENLFGEENIFISEFIRKGANIRLVQKSVVIHEGPTQSTTDWYSLQACIARVRMVKTIYGLIGAFYSILAHSFFHPKRKDYEIAGFKLFSILFLKVLLKKV